MVRAAPPASSRRTAGRSPRALLESELFGHARGAFTGATGERRGLFEEADGSTVFLDEVGEMSPAMQLRLLRVLQEGEVRRLGAPGVRKVNVRVIAATNADLEADVEAGRFRRDLYYRLNVFPIPLPPLRERTEDIPVLAETFLRPACRRARRAVPSISPEAMALLQAYPFPGNVRELENEIERAVALAEDGRPIGPEHLSDRMRADGSGPRGMSRPGTLAEAIEQLKQRMIEDALRDCGIEDACGRAPRAQPAKLPANAEAPPALANAPSASKRPKPPPSSLGACRRNPARAMRRVQLRGGARRPHGEAYSLYVEPCGRGRQRSRWALIIALAFSRCRGRA